MKKLHFLIAGAALFAACNSQPTTESTTGDSANVKSAVALPYTIGYSSSFELGNAAYSAAILSGSWKDWETNNLDNMKNWMADTILALHSDGSEVRGLDSMMARWKRDRLKYSSVIDSIDAVLPVRSTDRNEDWVLVWAREINTRPDGRKDTIALMETWRINKDGKADMLLQYQRMRQK